MLGHSVKVLLVSLRTNYVDYNVVICFASHLLVCFRLLAKDVVIANFFKVYAGHCTGKLFCGLNFALIPLKVITCCTL